MPDGSASTPLVPTDRTEEPNERATLQIWSSPLSITVSSQGSATAVVLALGVVGPAATIMVGYSVGLPVWGILVICLLQIVAAITRHRK